MRHVVRESLAGSKPRRISAGPLGLASVFTESRVVVTSRGVYDCASFFSLSFFSFFAAGGTEKLLSPAFKRDRPVIAAQSFRGARKYIRTRRRAKSSSSFV